MPAPPSPPSASMVPPWMVILLPIFSAPPPMPAPPSPPLAVREPSFPLSSLMVSLPEMISPSSDISSFFSRPALLLPLFSSLSPSSSMVASWPPFTVTAASPLSLTLIFRSSKVTSTLPPEVSMVTVCSFDSPDLPDSPVMTVSLSSCSMVSPCVTLFVPLVSPASTVMSPSAMFHVFA